MDSDFEAKVADFGFAKLIPDGVSHLTTRVKGTLGYLAPEYAMWGKVAESCDVYSFGILLLEIVSGRKPLEKLSNGTKRDIVQWATPFVQSQDFDQIADPRLSQNFDLHDLKSIVRIGLRCTDGNADSRPSMKQVVAWLKDALRTKKDDMPHLKLNELAHQDQDQNQHHEENYDKNHTDYEELEKQQFHGEILR